MGQKRILFISMPLPVIKDYTCNSGNAVYMMAGESYFYGIPGVTIIPHTKLRKIIQENPDFCERNFDIAIGMEANVLGSGHYISENTEFVKSIKIPSYFLGIGAQADKNYSFDFLKTNGDNIKLYIDAILESGGDITLRGEYTNECLKQLGYNNLFVSGCPSLYINRSNFKIQNEKVRKNEFKPIFNAQFVQDLNPRLYEKYKDSVFIDQDHYLELLYKPSDVEIKKYFLNSYLLKLLKNGRIFGDMNYYPWRQMIINGNFNFAYGSRMHGNIIAIQNNIPAFVKVIDSRTREIPDFFGIPNSIEYNFDENKDSLYDLYKSISYEKFNSLYPKRFKAFKDFLDKHNIPHRLDDSNDEFFDYLKNLNYETISLNYHKEKQYLNLFNKIEKDIPKRKLLERIFSVRNDDDKKHKVVSLLGIKIKFRKAQTLARVERERERVIALSDYRKQKLRKAA